MDDMVMMWPRPRDTMPGASARMVATSPVMLTLIIVRALCTRGMTRGSDDVSQSCHAALKGVSAQNVSLLRSEGQCNAAVWARKVCASLLQQLRKQQKLGKLGNNNKSNKDRGVTMNARILPLPD